MISALIAAALYGNIGIKGTNSLFTNPVPRRTNTLTHSSSSHV